MTGKLALLSMIALCSVAIGRSVIPSTVILDEISITGTLINVEELANTLQVCLDSGAKRILLPVTSKKEPIVVPDDLFTTFDFLSYSSAEEAVFKVPGVE